MKAARIKTQLQWVILKEGTKFVFYAPALELSTSGETFEQAKKRAEEVTGIFVEETIRRGTMEEALLELGWKKETGRQPAWIPPQVVGQVYSPISLPVPA